VLKWQAAGNISSALFMKLRSLFEGMPSVDGCLVEGV
jgi:hypothetical protein